MKRLLITFAISVSLFSQIPFPGGSSGGGSGSSTPSNPVPTLTWDNQSTATIVNVLGTEHLCSANPSGGINVRYASAPATPYSLTLQEVVDPTGEGSARSFSTNILFRESSTGKYVGLGLNVNSSGATFISIDNWTNATTYLSSPFANTATSWNPLIVWSAPSFIYIRERDDGTNLSFYYSLDGLNYIQISSNLSRTAFMAGGPNQIGYAVQQNTVGASLCTTVMQWVAQ